MKLNVLVFVFFINFATRHVRSAPGLSNSYQSSMANIVASFEEIDSTVDNETDPRADLLEKSLNTTTDVSNTTVASTTESESTAGITQEANSLLMIILTRFLNNPADGSNLRFRIFPNPSPSVASSHLRPWHRIRPSNDFVSDLDFHPTRMQMMAPFNRPFIPFYRSMWIPSFSKLANERESNRSL
jgi:hypothetical protein